MTILREMWARACVTAISAFQWSATPHLPPAAVIHHGIDRKQFTFRAEPDDYVCFLGRFIPDKGTLTAIRAARSLGVRLLLAGPRNEYFDACIAPEVDGRTVEYIGPVSGEGRDRFLGGARALLYPIEAPEPFGLVQVEAMMCGTPVVAMRLGATPEIVEEGVTGWLCADDADFFAQIPRAFLLDRDRIRATAEQRFSGERMASDYAALYARLATGR
jgi:glycosyltransferase involved in cell wall biosynthesis